MIGILSGVCEAVGKTTVVTACVVGLAGPASAIASLSGVWLVIVEAAKKN